MNFLTIIDCPNDVPQMKILDYTNNLICIHFLHHNHRNTIILCSHLVQIQMRTLTLDTNIYFHVYFLWLYQIQMLVSKHHLQNHMLSNLFFLNSLCLRLPNITMDHHLHFCKLFIVYLSLCKLKLVYQIIHHILIQSLSDLLLVNLNEFLSNVYNLIMYKQNSLIKLSFS